MQQAVDTHSASQEKTRLLRNPEVLCRVHTRSPPPQILSQINPLHNVIYSFFNLLQPKRERVRKDSIRVEVKRKHIGESERRFMSEGENEHLVRRYPGNARSSF
jgi:hypothetical protein